jgi:hypothetical protein
MLHVLTMNLILEDPRFIEKAKVNTIKHTIITLTDGVTTPTLL